MGVWVTLDGARGLEGTDNLDSDDGGVFMNGGLGCGRRHMGGTGMMARW